LEGSTSLEEALHFYNLSLQRLWKDIEDSQAREHDETIAAIVVLSTSEVCTPSDESFALF
jgi:hypothetical protein